MWSRIPSLQALIRPRIQAETLGGRRRGLETGLRCPGQLQGLALVGGQVDRPYRSPTVTRGPGRIPAVGHPFAPSRRGKTPSRAARRMSLTSVPEILVEHPFHVAAAVGVAADLFQALAFQLAEGEGGLALVRPDELACPIDEPAFLGIAELVQPVDLGRHRFVPPDLGIQDGQRRLGVGQCVVGAAQVRVAVEAVGGGQVARLHLVKDAHGVEVPHTAEIQPAAGAPQLGLQQGQVETDRVVAGQVGVGQIGFHLTVDLAEGGLVPDVGVLDAVDARGFGRDRDTQG